MFEFAHSIPDAGPISDPAPLTWQEFYRAWTSACVDAWDAGRQTPTVTLPLYLFPHVTSIENPCTGAFVTIKRTSPFEWRTNGNAPQ